MFCFFFVHIIRLEEKKTNTFDRLSKRSHGRRAHTGWGPFPILCKLFDTCSSVGNLNHLKTPFISRLVLDLMLFLNDNAQNKKLNHNKIALHLNHFEKEKK